MTLSQFRESLTSSEPPPGLSAPLAALWHDGRGDWEAAHRVAQDIPTAEGSWIHGYLHRKEGDATNAAYWYRRAAKPIASGTLEAEWEAIVTALLPQRAET
jgi:hypothetical protein